MCSHDNLTWTGGNYSEYLVMICGLNKLVSYLPLNHIAGQMADIYGAVIGGVCIYFAQPDALKGSLAITIKEVKPTVFVTVPRLLEKMYDKINFQIDSSGFAKKSLLNWARNQALNYHGAIIDGRDPTQFEFYNYKLAKSVVLDKVKRTIGLSDVRQFCCASAPISNEIRNFFLSLDCPVVNAFGLSESQGAGTMGSISEGTYKDGSVGKPMPSIDIQIQERMQVIGS